MSPASPLTSQLFSEAASHPKGQKKSPPRGVGFRILAHLFEEFPAPAQPKQIAKKARTPYPGTKKWLSRNDGVHVVDIGNGWYRARATVSLLRKLGFEPLKVHGLQVTMKSRAGGLPPRLGGHLQANKDGNGKGDWRGRLLTMQPIANGCLLSIRATTEPFSIPEFSEFTAWLEGCAMGGSVEVVNLELNVDVSDHRMRISGAQAMSIGGLRETLVKAYNKQMLGVLRVEACYHRLDAPMAEVAKLLNEIATPPEHYHPHLSPSFDSQEAYS